MHAKKQTIEPPPKSDITEVDRAARLSWQLVKITKELSVEDQHRVIEFAKGLRDQMRT
ncbi:hypothetical protein [Bosea sp. ASV33]|uniref:hypothetical protein n=1 Tax=Bosea sp. ASV33 TaxID=2795106 RepID=UPI0018EC3655|nr:hypothetical protein [Bosea sp. ASV33]